MPSTEAPKEAPKAKKAPASKKKVESTPSTEEPKAVPKAKKAPASKKKVEASESTPSTEAPKEDPKELCVERAPPPTTAEEEEEEEVEVEEIEYDGVKYLRSNKGLVYDMETSEEIGVWNSETNRIDAD